MADGRMLSKKISLNEAVAALENDTHRLLFTWGLSHLDIEGRISGSPKVFRAMVVPLLEHITSEKIAKFFKDATEKELILRYKVDKEWFIQYPKFKDNQRLRPDREAPSKIPAYDGELPEDSGTTPGVIPEDSGLKLSKDKLREETTLVSPNRGNGVDEDFEIWWKAYPGRRKQGKPVCLAKWRHLTKIKILPELAVMMVTLEAQKKSLDWTKNGGDYIPGPLPYLNQSKFIDESVNQPQTDKMDDYMDYLAKRDGVNQ
jgi:hypothetical protein